MIPQSRSQEADPRTAKLLNQEFSNAGGGEASVPGGGGNSGISPLSAAGGSGGGAGGVPSSARPSPKGAAQPSQKSLARRGPSSAQALRGEKAGCGSLASVRSMAMAVSAGGLF